MLYAVWRDEYGPSALSCKPDASTRYHVVSSGHVSVAMLITTSVHAGAATGGAVTALDGAADIASLGGLDEAVVGLGEGAFDVGGGVSTH